ncbi:MAG: asparagine synthase (glutamine-hydrolyzing) [Betaproteobacteria bacterium]|nr:asparagine synthase (glutamine-hydrolyzing) [Betaproteobacteria bacterium]
MCGISGFLSNDPGAPANLQAVRRMNDAIRHRGPDADGVWQHGPCALGHRRLSIIDLSAEANQPMCNEDGGIALVVNGEIYNFEELRKELLARGHRFRSKSDSEVILHLYEEHGLDCVRRLSGMFAFALFDTHENRLLLARDRSGKKPLFYRRLKHGIAFASEAHALLTGFPEEVPEVDYGAIDEFLTLQYVPSPRSAYLGNAKLPAAHYAVFTPGSGARVERYWSKPEAGTLSRSAGDLTQELLSLLESAVKRRLVSDVPLGAFLSGGVDSSLIVALMATQSTARVKSFSIGFPHADDSELLFARQVAQRYNTDHHEMVVDPSMTDVIGPIVKHHGEPFADSSAIAMYYLAQMTKEHVTVALSGDAADEVFAGYKRYRTARLGHIYDALPPFVRSLYRGALVGALHFPAPSASRYALAFPGGEATRYPSLVGHFTPAEKAKFYLPPMLAARSRATIERFERVLGESKSNSAIGRLADLDFQTYLTDDINVKVDIASMAHALEVRCPYLDTEVVEFAARLPADMLMRVRGKFLLRHAAAGLVPEPILRRRKRGFALPLKRWLCHDLRQMTHDLLLDRTARERGMFKPAYVSKLVGSLLHGSAQVDRVWTMLMLELWFREFIDKPPSSSRVLQGD